MYTGLWQRRSIAIDGGEPKETHTVLWLQALRYFADLRIPLDFAAQGGNPDALAPEALSERTRFSAFAGTVDPSPTHIRWTHAIDLRPRPGAVDAGDVFWQDGVLVEDGSFAGEQGTVHYREVWVPQPPGAGDLQVFELAEAREGNSGATLAVTGLLVIVGEHFLHLRDERGYPAGMAVPDTEAMTTDQLRHFLRFVADYGHRDPGTGRLQIRTSGDPNRVGAVIFADSERQGNTWLDRSLSCTGVPVLYRWHLVESTMEPTSPSRKAIE